MLKKLLVAIDDSPISKKVVDAAVDLAKGLDAEILLISVVPLPEHAGTVGEVVEAKAEGEKRFGRYLWDAQQKVEAAGVKARTKLLFGHPANMIVKCAGEGKFDLIVMGYKGVSPIQRFLLGSVSSAVTQHCPCTVMLVK